MIKKKKKDANIFKKAIENTPDIANCYQSGLQAFLKKDSKKIELEDTNACMGSVDIDTCTTSEYPNDSRWDYALCYNSEVFFVEVHSANTGQVKPVLKKLQWLKDWLNQKAPDIKALKAKSQSPYIWIQSNNFKIDVRTSQHRQLVQAGLMPISRLSLK
jgi:hypothetical protein